MAGKKGIPSVPGFLLALIAGALEAVAGVFKKQPL
jgi:hypothetical protein